MTDFPPVSGARGVVPPAATGDPGAPGPTSQTYPAEANSTPLRERNARHRRRNAGRAANGTAKTAPHSEEVYDGARKCPPAASPGIQTVHQHRSIENHWAAADGAGNFGCGAAAKRPAAHGRPDPAGAVGPDPDGPDAAQVLAWSILSKGMVSLAWPIFAYLAVEGLQHTSSFPRYALRLLGVAVISEVPYDLAMSGQWVDWSSQNFLFSLLIGLVALYMVQEVGESKEKAGPLRILFPVGAVVWTFLFQTQLGILVVLAMTAMYFLRERPVWRDIVVAVLGLATIPASLSVLLIHFHKPGPSMFPKWVYYGSYPLQLLLIGLACHFLL